MTTKTRVTFWSLLLALTIAGVLWLAAPPRAWSKIDFANSNVNDLKTSLPGYAGDHAFKRGFGWVSKNFIFEHWLLIFEGMSSEQPGQVKISSVDIQGWVGFPLSQKNRFRSRVVYERKGYDIIGGP